MLTGGQHKESLKDGRTVCWRSTWAPAPSQLGDLPIRVTFRQAALHAGTAAAAVTAVPAAGAAVLIGIPVLALRVRGRR